MKLDLLPVIDILYSNQDIPLPAQYPFWEYPDAWDAYNAACYQKAGFPDEMKPYLPGSSLFLIAAISEANLRKVVIDHTRGLRTGEYGREEACALSGGYVLRIDGQDKFFPQCCGDLADIRFWENLEKGMESGFFAGHPEPSVTIREEVVTLDLTKSEFEESFAPKPTCDFVQFDIPSLRLAIDDTKRQLADFEQRLKKINQEENLKIDDIGGLLIWDDVNYV